MVNAARLYEGCPGVTSDSYGGMKELLNHLIKVHKHKKIAFILGPEGNWVVQERYRAYVDVLKENQIPFDSNLVSPFSGWGEAKNAVKLFIDERKLKPGIGIEAIAVSNDPMAIDAMEELQSRGVKIPGDIAIIGFDDDVRSFFSSPPLTTAGYNNGNYAFEIMLDLLDGKKVPEKSVAPAWPVIRRSCGCQYRQVTEASAGHVEYRSKQGLTDETINQKKNAIMEDVTKLFLDDPINKNVLMDLIGQVIDSFFTTLNSEIKTDSSEFLLVLEKLLHEEGRGEGDVSKWQSVLSSLRNHILPLISGLSLSYAEDLWQQARVLIDLSAQRENFNREYRDVQQSRLLMDIETMLITTFSVSGFLLKIFRNWE